MSVIIRSTKNSQFDQRKQKGWRERSCKNGKIAQKTGAKNKLEQRQRKITERKKEQKEKRNKK